MRIARIPPSHYLVRCSAEKVQGPFDVKFIEAMVLAKVYPADVEVRCDENGSPWTPFSQISSVSLVEPVVSPELPAYASSDGVVGKMKRESRIRGIVTFSTALLGLGVTLWAIFAMARPQSSLTVTSKQAINPDSPITPTPRIAPSSSSAYLADTPRYSPPSAPPPSRPRESNPYLYSSKPPEPPPVATATPTQPAPSQPTEDDTEIYRDAMGNSYRVSNEDYLRLSQKKKTIDEIKKSFEKSEEELKSLAARLTEARENLDTSSKRQVNSFNEKVAQANKLNETLDALSDDYNRRAAEFNAELARVGTLIY